MAKHRSGGQLPALQANDNEKSTPNERTSRIVTHDGEISLCPENSALHGRTSASERQRCPSHRSTHTATGCDSSRCRARVNYRALFFREKGGLCEWHHLPKARQDGPVDNPYGSKAADHRTSRTRAHRLCQPSIHRYPLEHNTGEWNHQGIPARDNHPGRAVPLTASARLLLPAPMYPPSSASARVWGLGQAASRSARRGSDRACRY